MDHDDFEKNLAARGGGGNTSFGSNDGGSSRKETFYRRQSMHIFILAKDEMLCCCCVPLGMALHIISFFDIIVAIFLIIQGIDFNDKISANPEKPEPEIYRQFYKMISGMCFASMAAYSVPRAVLYLLTLGRTKSFQRIQWYFRARIVTFLVLFIILGSCFLFCFYKADALVKVNPDLNRTLILVVFGSFAFIWLILDIYWSLSLRAYKDSKKEDPEDHLLTGNTIKSSFGGPGAATALNE